jgi:hypothetical protein
VESKKSADVAFGLKRGRGEYPRKKSLTRDIVLAGCVTLRMKEGMTWQDAIGEVANCFFEDGTGDKAVKQAYSENKETFHNTPIDELQEMFSEMLKS